MLKKIVLCIVVLMMSGVSFLGGKYLKETRQFRVDDKKVAIRVEKRKNEINYSLGMILEFLECKLEKNGFKVYEPSFLGDLYPERLNDAGVNIFVRGKSVSLDKRYVDEAHNIYLVDEFNRGNFEELRNFDEYISTNPWLIKGAEHKGLKVQFLEYEPCGKKPKFKNKGKDIVYIYEGNNANIADRLYRDLGAKSYTSMKFYEMGKKKREEVFRDARVVVYDCLEEVDIYGGSYWYALEDILSYGRKAVFNRNCGNILTDKDVNSFSNYDELVFAIKY